MVGGQTTSQPRFASPETYTPRHLAEKILTSKSALEGERKQVTVLFADLKGSMELLADRDPEEARKILDPVLERMMEAVHRYEGTVNQVMGDGIMALFGAPLAHEDHAVRACYAALRMQDAVRRYSDELRRAQGVEVQIRVGLNSGEVVVRSVGSDLRMDYTAVGQTTHLAARMEQLALPGTVRLTGETLRLAEGYVEDLHWIDGETQALLDSLVDSLGSARLLLLVNYRPEYQHAWGSKSHYSQMRLDTLSAESAGELLNALLGHDPGLVPLKQLLVKRGNPFFLEETVRTLVETKALDGSRGRYRLTQPLQAIQVPATVQAILAARIDRLGPEDKRLLQTASVIGKDLPFVLLQAIAELPEDALRCALDRLQAAEFVYEAGVFPDLEYSFKHALTHEVTYGGLLQERRRELHARIVEAIETLHRDRLGEQIERLAHHALRGELREKAIHYLRQAGGKATARLALSDALAWLEQALGLLEALPQSQSNLEQAVEIRLELRAVLFGLGEPRRVLERLREAAALADRLNDDRQRSRVCAFMANVHSLLGEPDEALATGTRGLELASRLGDAALRLLAATFLAQAHYVRGEYDRAVELATNNLASLPPGSGASDNIVGLPVGASVFNHAFIILGLAQLGRFAEAADPVAEMLRLAESTQQAFTVGWAPLTAGVLSLARGDWAKARSLIEASIAVIRAGNIVPLLSGAIASAAWSAAHVGEVSQAVLLLREAEELLEQLATRGLVGGSSWPYHALGRASLLLGRLDEAKRLADCAVESSRRHPGFAAHALHLRGDIATHPDRFDANSGEAYYRNALALAEPRGMRPLVAHCHLGLGKLYRRTGQREQAQEHLTTATTMYHEMGMTYWLEKAEAEARQFN